MAVGFGAVGTVAAANNAAVSPGIPASMASGDLMVLVWQARGNAVPATPSGWTSTAWTGYNSTGSGPGIHVMFRAWQSGDTAPSVTIFDGGGTGQTVMAYIVRVTGADLTDPFGYTSGSQRVNSAWFDFSASATADETWNATTVTRPTDGALMLAAVKQQDFGVNGASTSITATWNKVVESGSTLGSDLGVWAEQTTSVSSVSSITVDTSDTQTGYWTSVALPIYPPHTNVFPSAIGGGSADPAYRQSSRLGNAQLSSPQSLPVPTGTATNDITVAVLSVWNATGTHTLTGGNGTWTKFHEYNYATTSGTQYLSFWWKRATSADSGNYTVGGWTGTAWVEAAAISFSGVSPSATVLEAHNHAESTGSNNYPAVSVSPADLKPALVFIGEQYTPGASTPPTNFTEVQDGSETLALSYRLPGAAGTYSTSGGTGSVGNNDYKSAHLISVASGATTGLTATAYNPTVKVQVFAQNAAGTGTANNVTAGEAATNAQATNNTAAGTAGNSTTKVDAAGGVAAAAAAGQQPAAKVSAAAGGAAATGTANGVTADVKGQATAATATGAGVNAAGKVDAPSGSAAATGAGLDVGSARTPTTATATATGQDATAKINSPAGAATATGVAHDPTPARAATPTADTATATAAGQGATTKINPEAVTATATGTVDVPSTTGKATADLASGTAVAHQPTIDAQDGSTATNAQAECATATAAAQQPGASVVASAGVANATAAGQGATGKVGVSADTAVSAGGSNGVTASVKAPAGVATATATALDPPMSVKVSAQAVQAVGSGGDRIVNGSFEGTVTAYTHTDGGPASYFSFPWTTDTTPDPWDGSQYISGTTNSAVLPQGLIVFQPAAGVVKAGTVVQCEIAIRFPAGVGWIVSGRYNNPAGAYLGEAGGIITGTGTGTWQLVRTAPWTHNVDFIPGVQARTQDGDSATGRFLAFDAAKVWVVANAAATVAPPAGSAVATGAAEQPTAQTSAASNAPADPATASAAGQDATGKVGAAAATASATGAAGTLTSQVNPTAQTATASAQGLDAAMTTAQAGVASATATANTTTSTVKTSAQPSNALATPKQNLAAPFSDWGLSGTGVSVDGNNVLSFSTPDNGAAARMKVYVGGHTSDIWFSVEVLNSAAASPEVPAWGPNQAGWISSQYYYGPDGVTPALSSAGYTNNGQARKNTAGVGNWGTADQMGSQITGPNVHWVEIIWWHTSAYSGTGTVQYRNPVISVTNLAPSGSGWPPVGTAHQASVNSPAGSASGTATANNPQALIDETGDAQTATASAAGLGATGAVFVYPEDMEDPPAGEGQARLSLGVGTAYNPQVSTTIDRTPDTATATAAGQGATGSVQVSAGVAAATGVAPQASLSLAAAAPAGSASATGAGQNAAASVQAPAGVASATGTAQQPGVSTSISRTPTTATGTAAGQDAAASVKVPAGVASGTGAAYDPYRNTNVPADVATAAGVAHTPSIQTPGATNATADPATGTATAYNPTISVSASAGAAAATGTGNGATAALGVTTLSKPQQWSNGYLLTDGTGWGDNGVYDGTQTYKGHGTYKMPPGITYANGPWQSIEPGRTYRISAAMKADTATGNWYWGLHYRDVDGYTLYPYTNYIPNLNTVTTLTAQLKNGDTTAQVADASAWSAAEGGYLAIWGHTDSRGVKWRPNTYSRYAKYLGGVRVSGNTVYLEQPWDLGTFEAGTQVGQTWAAGTFLYFGNIGETPRLDWTRYEVLVGPSTSPDGAWNNPTKFPHGAASVRFIALNLNNAAGQVWIGEAELLEEGPATGVGTAWPQRASTRVNAGCATATATAEQAAAAPKAPAGAGTGAGTANGLTAGVSPTPATATGTGAANQPTAQTTGATNVFPGAASATATANQPTVSVKVPAGAGAGTGTGQGATGAVQVQAGAASGTGTAHQPTITTAGATNAQAGVASATGQALDPTVSISQPTNVTPTTATATGTAHQPLVSTAGETFAQAGAASGTAAAGGVTVSLKPAAGVALAAAAEAQASVALGIPTGVGTGTGTSNSPTTSVGAAPDTALAVGTAETLLTQIAVAAQCAVGTGIALTPSVITTKVTLQVTVPSSAYKVWVERLLDGPPTTERVIIGATVVPTSLRRLVTTSGDAVSYETVELVEGDVLTLAFHLKYRDVNGVEQVFDLTGFSGLTLRVKQRYNQADGDAFFTASGSVVGSPTLGVCEVPITGTATVPGRFFFTLKGTKSGNPRTLAHGDWVIANV